HCLPNPQLVSCIRSQRDFHVQVREMLQQVANTSKVSPRLVDTDTRPTVTKPVESHPKVIVGIHTSFLHRGRLRQIESFVQYEGQFESRQGSTSDSSALFAAWRCTVAPCSAPSTSWPSPSTRR